jgi:hypothetical protein
VHTLPIARSNPSSQVFRGSYSNRPTILSCSHQNNSLTNAFGLRFFKLFQITQDGSYPESHGNLVQNQEFHVYSIVVLQCILLQHHPMQTEPWIDFPQLLQCLLRVTMFTDFMNVTSRSPLLLFWEYEARFEVTISWGALQHAENLPFWFWPAAFSGREIEHPYQPGITVEPKAAHILSEDWLSRTSSLREFTVPIVNRIREGTDFIPHKFSLICKTWTTSNLMLNHWYSGESDFAGFPSQNACWTRCIVHFNLPVQSAKPDLQAFSPDVTRKTRPSSFKTVDVNWVQNDRFSVLTFSFMFILFYSEICVAKVH